MSALSALTRGGYVGRDDGEALHNAYAFLRTLEHRIQLHQLRRTHAVPEDDAALRRLGRSLGFVKHPVVELDKQWLHHRREVRRLHEKLFYRPLLNSVARISGDEARLSAEAAGQRLAALGYQDPAAALRHLEAMTSGVSRRAAIQRTLLPVMLGWFADAPDPDAGLFGFRRISESLGDSPWYLRLLRDEGEVAERLARLLATSRYATDLLQREPQGVRLLGEELTPLTAEALTTEMRSSASRQDDPRPRFAPSVRYAAGSCSGSPPGTCSGTPTSPTSARHCRASPTPPWRPPSRWRNGRWLPPSPSRNPRPGWRLSPWDATAASSSPTAATRT